nr:hypothetical protein [Granulosicoccus antarcticus]
MNQDINTVEFVKISLHRSIVGCVKNSALHAGQTHKQITVQIAGMYQGSFGAQSFCNCPANPLCSGGHYSSLAFQTLSQIH